MVSWAQVFVVWVSAVRAGFSLVIERVVVDLVLSMGVSTCISILAVVTRGNHWAEGSVIGKRSGFIIEERPSVLLRAVVVVARCLEAGLRELSGGFWRVLNGWTDCGLVVAYDLLVVRIL